MQPIHGVTVHNSMYMQPPAPSAPYTLPLDSKEFSRQTICGQSSLCYLLSHMHSMPLC